MSPSLPQPSRDGHPPKLRPALRAVGASQLISQSVEGSTAGGRFGHSVSGAGDVNGDGHDDVIVAAFRAAPQEVGQVWVYYGAATGIDTNRFWTFQGWVPMGELGHQVAGDLDVNGDGLADIVIGNPILQTNQLQGAVMVFHGSPQGLASRPDWVAYGERSAESNLGFSVASAGDVNDDGYDDLIVGSPYERNHSIGTRQVRRGRAYLFLGGRGGLQSKPHWSVGQGQERMSFGWSVGGTGDLNGDGFADLVVGDPDHSTTLQDVGRAHVFFGSREGPSATPDWTITGTQTGQQLGVSVHIAGDVNGDGLADLVIAANHASNGQEEEGLVLVFHGSRTGLGLEPSWTFEPNQVGFVLGHSVATAGDVNGDGFGDLVIGSFYGEQSQADEGVVLVFHGSPRGLPRVPDWSGRGAAWHSGYGATVRSAGDVNGDGYGDLIVGQTHYSGSIENQGRARLYFGSARGLAGSTGWRPPGEKFGFELRSVVLPFPNTGWMLALVLASLGGGFSLTRWYYRRRERVAATLQVAREAALREERIRISQDLHDQLGAHLTGIALRSGGLRRELDGREPQWAHQLRTIEATAGQLVDGLAEIVWLTRPANDSLEQLVSYILEYAGKALEPADITCRFDVPAKLPDVVLGYDLRHDLLLSVKEALHNVVKHAKASQVLLSIRPGGGRVEFAIEDNGRGLSSGAKAGRGNGLRNMRERMRRHGGQLEIGSDARGTLVRLAIPLPERSILK